MPVGTEVKEGTGVIIAVGVFSLGPMVGVPKSNPGVGVGVDGGAIVEVAGDSMVADGVGLGGFSVGLAIGSVAGGFVDEGFGVAVGIGVIVVLPPPGVEVGIGGTIVGVTVGKSVGEVAPISGVDVGKDGTMDGGSSVGVGVRSGGAVTVGDTAVVGGGKKISALVSVGVAGKVCVGVGGVVRLSIGTRSIPSNRSGGTSIGSYCAY